MIIFLDMVNAALAAIACKINSLTAGMAPAGRSGPSAALPALDGPALMTRPAES
jgi:hypothetical protein